MKKMFLLLFVSMVIVSCSDNSTSPSTTTYTKVEITGVDCTLLPMVDLSGSKWDSFGAPDVYLDFSYTSDSKHTSILKSQVFDDITTASFPLQWSVTGLKDSISKANYTILINDDDSPLDPDNIATVYFKASDYTKDYPSSVTFQNANGTGKFVAYLKWSN